MTGSRYQIVMVTACLAVASMVYGLSMPLMALALTKQGVGGAMIGLSTASQFLAVFIVAPFMMPMINNWGTARAMYYAIIIAGVTFLLFPLFPNVYAWFPLRIALGISASVIWIGGEAWINDAVDEGRRGRVIAAYTMVIAAGFALGPAILSITGSEGWTPFVASAVITVLGALPLLPALDSGPALAGRPSARLVRFVLLAPVAVLTYGAFAATDAMLLTFLSPYAIGAGLSEAQAVNLVTAMAVGSMLFMWPVGWLADHADRHHLIMASILGMLAGAVLLPQIIAVSYWNYLFMLVFGGFFAVMYSVPLVLLGQQFKGADLAAASTLCGIVFSVGSVGGPLLAGWAIAGLGRSGMPLSLALLYLLLLPLPFVARRRPAAG